MGSKLDLRAFAIAIKPASTLDFLCTRSAIESGGKTLDNLLTTRTNSDLHLLRPQMRMDRL
jgi:hypothetical protein